MDEALLNGLRDAMGLSLLVFVRELLKSTIHTVQSIHNPVLHLLHSPVEPRLHRPIGQQSS
jgi:hypothetical protein